MIGVDIDVITYISTLIKCMEKMEGINKIPTFIANLSWKLRNASTQNLYKNEWYVPLFCLMNILS
jgi:hypothetical protein